MSKTSDNAAAVVLDEGDRFHKILASEAIRFDAAPGLQIVIVFYVIRRNGGTYSIISINETFKDRTVVARDVQTKDGVAEADVDREVGSIVGFFSKRIEDATGVKIVWHTLDLTAVRNIGEQVRLMGEWERLGISGELPPDAFTPSVN